MVNNHIESPVQGVLLLYNYLINNASSLDPDIKAKLMDLVSPAQSPVVAVVETAEYCYANIDKISPELAQIAALCANIALLYNFHGMADNARGSAIAYLLINKAGTSLPSLEDSQQAPEPKLEYREETPNEETSPTP